MPPVAATLGFVYLLNPATGPVNTVLAKLGVEGPLWFNDPAGRSRRSYAQPLGHRQHDDHLPRRGARRARSISTSRPSSTAPARCQRLRWVTLPTISPVILFAVVLGVIQGLQYFTQAYVAASVAGGPGVTGRRASTLELGYPEGSTLFYPVLLYYHGFRFFNMGYASAMAVLLLVVAFAVTIVIIRGSRRRCTTRGAAR